MVKYHKIPGLGDLLQSFTLNPPADKSGYDAIEVLSQDNSHAIDKGQDGEYSFVKTPEIMIWYRNSKEFSIDSLANLVANQFGHNGHPINRGTIIAFLALFHLTLENTEAPIAHLEELLENLVPAQVTLFQVFSQPSERFPTFKFGDYSYGKLPIKELRDLCKAAESDYLDKYGSDLKGKLALTRTIDRLALINWQPYIQRRHAIRMVPNLGYKVRWLMDEYFARMQEPLFDRFYREMIEHQQIYIALGSSYINPESHRILPRTNRIAGYRYLDNSTPNGFISPHIISSVSLNLGSAPLQIPFFHDILKKNYEFSGFLDTELHYTMETYTRFLTRAKVHENRGYFSEAFLHYVIALDLVFGGSGSLADTISKRVGALTHRLHDDSTYVGQVRSIKEHYNLRSKYVHEGRTITQDALEPISELCKHLLHAFLYLQYKSPGLQIDAWLKEIDIIVAQLEAGKMPDEETLLSCGIIGPRN